MKIKVVHGKSAHELDLPPTTTIFDLKQSLEHLTQVPVATQKLLYKGQMFKDDSKPLDACGLSDGSKVILMGSTLGQIIQVNFPSPPSSTHGSDSGSNATAHVEEGGHWSDMTEHRKVLKQGRPDDIVPALKGQHLPLPNPLTQLTGLINKSGHKTRFTFRTDLDQVWIVTNEQTHKLMKGMIRGVTSQPIKSDPDYTILAVQLGPTEKSNYYVYWVPCQYVESLKRALLSGHT